MSASQDKKEARKLAKARRAEAHETYAGLGGGIFIQPFIQSLQPAPGAVVAGYVARGDEADPAPLIQILADHGCQIALARVSAPDQPLRFIQWAPGEPLAPGPYDILEPTGESALLPDFVLVPMLAFSADGHRLGYGGGYYDRTLEALRTQKPGIIAVGLAFAAQEVTNLPVEPEDQPLDWIVTERGARCFQDLSE
ncbi:MAG: 5-formyltetrahydrofolate cyclo-ligase [Parvibaculum sp.]